MIVILKRDDLSQKFRDWGVESLKLDHFELPTELVEHAELIVFVEGSEVKFLKHFPEMQSKNSVEVLLSYIISTAPVTPARHHWSLKPYGQRQIRKNKD